MNLDPGIFPHRSTAEHRALPFFSPSRLGRLDVSPAEDRHHQEEPEETRPMRLGTITHGNALEGGVITDPNWVEKPAGMNFGHLDGKAWKTARLAENPNAIFVPAEDFQRAEGAAQSLRSHPKVAEWLRTGQTEVSMVWQDRETGLVLKGRTDLIVIDTLDGPCVVDLKIMGRGVFRDDVERAIEGSGAWMQVPTYCDALETLTGTFHTAKIIACSPDAPWPVEIYTFPRWLQAEGLRHARELFRLFQECERTGVYPADGRYDNPRGWELQCPRIRRRIEHG